MFISAAFNAVVGAAHSAIEGLAVLLTPAAGSLAVALAIVVFTLLVRLLISPLTYVQVRGERRRAALAPHLAELQKKHGADRTALATATMDLHREHGVSMFAGLLPGLAQAPFFMVMYRVAAHAPAGAVFGVPLTAHLAAGWPVFAVLLVLATALAWWSARRMSAAAPPAAGEETAAQPTGGRKAAGGGATSRQAGARPAGGREATGGGAAARQAGARPAGGRKAAGGGAAARPAAVPPASGRKNADRGGTGRQAARRGVAQPSAVAQQAGPLPVKLMRYLPYFTVLMVAWLPLAGALYLVTSTAWTALEHAIWRRPVTTGNR